MELCWCWSRSRQDRNRQGEGASLVVLVPVLWSIGETQRTEVEVGQRRDLHAQYSA